MCHHPSSALLFPYRDTNSGVTDDFFVGIGDINSSFLPPTPQAPPTTPPPALAASDASTPPPITPPAAAAEEGTSEEDGLLLQQKLLDQVSEARPLAKLQEELEGQADPTTTTADQNSTTNATIETSTAGGDGAKTANGETGVTKSDDGDSTKEQNQQVAKPRKPLLNDNDRELERLSRVSVLTLTSSANTACAVMTDWLCRYCGKSIPASTTRSTIADILILYRSHLDVMSKWVPLHCEAQSPENPLTLTYSSLCQS